MIELNDLTTNHIGLQLYTLLTLNVLLFNAVLSLDHRLPKDLYGMRFVDCNFLKPYYTSHILKNVSFLAVEALPCNSNIHYVTLK